MTRFVTRFVTRFNSSRLSRVREAFNSIQWLPFTFFSFPLLDELIGTIPVLAIPLLRSDWNLDYSQVGWLVGISGLSAWIVQPVIYAGSDQWSKRTILMLALVGMIGSLALAGSSPTFGVLLLAFLLMGAFNGPILTMATLFLIESNLAGSLRTMTRWTLMGALGDLAGPALIAAAFALGMGWRALFWAGALIWLAALIALVIQRLPENPRFKVKADSDSQVSDGADSDGEATPDRFSWQLLLDNMRLAIRTPQLLRWLALQLLPNFLDEMFLVFAALLLQDRLGMSPAAIGIALEVHIVGALVGLALLERFGNRFPPAQVLGWLALTVLAGLLLLVLTTSPWLAIIALVIVGFGASGWYPIASAEAYRALPGLGGTVSALSSLATPVEVAVPLLIGFAAQRWGIQVGVALIMLAPVAVLLLRPRNALPVAEYSPASN